MIKDNKIILHQQNIILKLLQDFKEYIKDIKLKGCTMGKNNQSPYY